MEPINIAQFIILFKEFSRVHTEVLKAYLPIAQYRVPATVWGIRTNYGQALLLAHMLTIQGFGSEGSGGGAVTGETVGDLSRTYGQVGQAGSGDDELRTTRYGIMFIELRNEFIVGAKCVGPVFPKPYGYEPA